MGLKQPAFAVDMMMSSPYFRALIVGVVWIVAVAFKMLSRSPGNWSAFSSRIVIIILTGWLITTLVIGFIGTRFERFRSWWSIGLGTVAGWFLILGAFSLFLPRVYGPSSPAEFKNTDAMMVHFATEATKWVKADRNLDLDYSIDSIRIIEEELGRISKEVNGANPQAGTFGMAVG